MADTTMGTATGTRPALFLRNATGLVKAWSTFDAFVYSFWSVNLITLGLYGMSFVYTVPDGQLLAAILVFGVLTTFLVVTYAMLVSVMPRTGGDYAWQSRVLGGGLGFDPCQRTATGKIGRTCHHQTEVGRIGAAVIAGKRIGEFVAKRLAPIRAGGEGNSIPADRDDRSVGWHDVDRQRGGDDTVAQQLARDCGGTPLGETWWAGGRDLDPVCRTDAAAEDPLIDFAALTRRQIGRPGCEGDLAPAFDAVDP